MRPLLSGPVPNPEHLRGGDHGLHQHHATPVDALSRRRPARKRAICSKRPDGDRGRANVKVRSDRIAGPRTSSTSFSIPDARLIMAYDVGDFPTRRSRPAKKGSTMRALPPARPKPNPKASYAVLGVLLLHRKPAASRRPRQWVASAPASVCGNPPKSRVNPVGTIEILTGSHSHGQGHETTFAATDRGTSSACRSAQVADRPRRHTDKVQFGMGNLRLAPSIAGRGTAIIKAMEKVEAKGQEDRRRHGGLEASEKRHRPSRTASSRLPAPTSRSRWPMVATRPPTPRIICPTAMEARPEGNRLLRPDQLHLPGGSLPFASVEGRSRQPGKTSLRQLRGRGRFSAG